MEIRDGPEGPDGPVLYISYCARHARPQPHLSGERLATAPAVTARPRERRGARRCQVWRHDFPSPTALATPEQAHGW